MATPHSRNEEILMSIIGGTPYRKKPLSREEYLLIELKKVIEAGGGGLTPEQIERLKELITEAVLEKTDTIYEKLWFEGTRAEWNALTRAQKSKYLYILLIDEHKIYNYDKTINRMDLAVNGSLSIIENMIASVEETQAKNPHSTGDIITLITYDTEHNPIESAFYRVTKPIEVGDTLIKDDTSPDQNIEPWEYKTVADAIEATKNPKSISNDEIDELFDNLP